ncbi:MAG: hypothetical protein II233_00865 [Clostridia bacterium]|nr:hypothetical protein [Clostridia bacterium]
MRCENIFCIYCLRKECTLNEISLDIQGNCENCIYVDIDENILEEQKKEVFLTKQKNRRG